jgi:hypothetical protein
VETVGCGRWRVGRRSSTRAHLMSGTVPLGEFSGNVRAHFEGEPLMHDEIQAAADLRAKELVTGYGTIQQHILLGGSGSIEEIV